MTDAQALIPMADLGARWGVTSNTVSRRLSFLGIKPIRQGNFRFITPDELEIADALQQHILSGKPMETFPRLTEEEGTKITRREKQQISTPNQETIVALVAAIQAATPADPLKRAKELANAAAQKLILANDELSLLLGQNVSRWKTDTEAYGYLFKRYTQKGRILWTIKRIIESD